MTSKKVTVIKGFCSDGDSDSDERTKKKKETVESKTHTFEELVLTK